MSTFDIDYPSLVNQLLPVRLRKFKMLRWLQCLITPVVELYHSFCSNRTNNLYFLKHSSQVTCLQGVLNDMFDPVSRRIYITDGGFTDALFVYLVAEVEPLWLGTNSEAGTTWFPDPQWLYTGAESITAGYSFIIKIPISIVYDAIRLSALVDKYRMPSKNNYTIQTF